MERTFDAELAIDITPVARFASWTRVANRRARPARLCAIGPCAKQLRVQILRTKKGQASWFCSSEGVFHAHRASRAASRKRSTQGLWRNGTRGFLFDRGAGAPRPPSDAIRVR